jgi:hypothetical protein
VAILYNAGGSRNWYNLSGKQFGNMLSRPWKLSSPFNPVILLLGIYLRKAIRESDKDSCSGQFITAQSILNYDLYSEAIKGHVNKEC